MLAIVLVRRDVREFDQQISCLTAEAGKLEMLARGVKKITAKNSSALEPGTLVDLTVVPGKEQALLTTAELVDAHPGLWRSSDKLILVGQVFHLVNQVIQTGQPEPAVYRLLVDFLRALEEPALAAPLAAPAFLLRLASSLGFTPELFRCNRCSAAFGASDIAWFEVASGGLVNEGCRQEGGALPAAVELTAAQQTFFKQLLSMPWSELFQLPVSPSDLAPVSKTIRYFAQYHLELEVKNFLGQPLVSDFPAPLPLGQQERKIPL